MWEESSRGYTAINDGKRITVFFDRGAWCSVIDDVFYGKSGNVFEAIHFVEMQLGISLDKSDVRDIPPTQRCFVRRGSEWLPSAPFIPSTLSPFPPPIRSIEDVCVKKDVQPFERPVKRTKSKKITEKRLKNKEREIVKKKKTKQEKEMEKSLLAERKREASFKALEEIMERARKLRHLTSPS